MLAIGLWEIICLFRNLPTAESFVFVKCIYFFINYMDIVRINVLLILYLISESYILRWDHLELRLDRKRYIQEQVKMIFLFVLLVE